MPSPALCRQDGVQLTYGMMLQDRASEFDDIDAHVEVDDGQSFLPHHLHFQH